MTVKKVSKRVSKVVLHGRGGPGRGQGRKPLDGATDLSKKNVNLNAESIEIYHELGEGDLSLGIRRGALKLSGRKNWEPKNE